jgi:hypothetical protein
MPRLPTRAVLLAATCAVASIPAAGCGGAGGGGASSANTRPAQPSPQVAAAQRPVPADFPQPHGRTLRQLADTLTAGPRAELATTAYTPGTNRIGFGVVGTANDFVYGPTAIYVARGENGRALGPYLAPADSLQVRPPFRSRTSASDPGEVQAVYHAQVPLPTTGRWLVLTATRSAGQVLGAAASITVARSVGIPGVGDRAPRVHTPTLASVGGDVSKIDTRVPPDQMHDVDLADVLGKRPVVLLFATPALCQSRVCGPVTDVAAQLQTVYGKQVAFIHNEVYVDNDPSKGLRPQLLAYGLHTEPWLFAIDRHGRIAARLEGAFGIDEFRQAIEAAQRG